MRLMPRQQDRRPDPEELRTDDRGATLAGTALWLASLVAVMLDRDQLLAEDRGWWVWACVAGVVLGLVGLVHVHQREMRARRRPPDLDAGVDRT